jgi:hypothetical protein
MERGKIRKVEGGLHTAWSTHERYLAEDEILSLFYIFGPRACWRPNDEFTLPSATPPGQY